MDDVERIAARVYHMECMEPLWADLDNEKRKEILKQVFAWLVARRHFSCDSVLIAKEAYRLNWNKMSEDEKILAIQHTSWFVAAHRNIMGHF